MIELKLDEELDRQIEDLWFEGESLVYSQNYLKAQELMEKTWEMLPAPKECYAPSFHITENLTRAFMGLEQFEDAKKWLEIHKTTGIGRIDGGEKDVLEGEFFYMQGEIEKAKPCFVIANKKSGGRAFQRKDRKHYKDLLSKEDIRPTSLTELVKTAKKEIKNQNYSNALDLLYDALNLNLVKVDVHFNKGLCHFELGEFDHAADSFTRAYMLDGDTIFSKHDPKYFEFLKTKIDLAPPTETESAQPEIEPKKEEKNEPKKKPWWKF